MSTSMALVVFCLAVGALTLHIIPAKQGNRHLSQLVPEDKG